MNEEYLEFTKCDGRCLFLNKYAVSYYEELDYSSQQTAAKGVVYVTGGKGWPVRETPDQFREMTKNEKSKSD